MTKNETSKQLNHCAIAVRDWLAGGCDTSDIPRTEIAVLAEFCKVASNDPMNAALDRECSVNDLNDAQVLQKIETVVYQSTRIFEQLENAGRLIGNGHHARQSVSMHAKLELAKRLR